MTVVAKRTFQNAIEKLYLTGIISKKGSNKFDKVFLDSRVICKICQIDLDILENFTEEILKNLYLVKNQV